MRLLHRSYTLGGVGGVAAVMQGTVTVTSAGHAGVGLATRNGAYVGNSSAKPPPDKSILTVRSVMGSSVMRMELPIGSVKQTWCRMTGTPAVTGSIPS